MTLSTLASIERRLAKLPPPGHARRAALDALRADLWRYGVEARVCRHAARVRIDGIVAHGADLGGALRNWCAVVRRMEQREDAA